MATLSESTSRNKAHLHALDGVANFSAPFPLSPNDSTHKCLMEMITFVSAAPHIYFGISLFNALLMISLSVPHPAQDLTPSTMKHQIDLSNRPAMS